jgi:hypothetical protein
LMMFWRSSRMNWDRGTRNLGITGVGILENI